MNENVILMILDGWGYSEKLEGNAVAQANTPNLSMLLDKYPNELIGTSGHYVGLPDGQMGNSEVGHLNLGAGRIVKQDVTRIDQAIKNGEFLHDEALVDIMTNLLPDKSLHIMGLVSYGGVHSTMSHLKELLWMTKKYRSDRVYLHVFTDGRDSPPHSGIKYIREIEKFMDGIEIGEIATISGRYYAMDRDNRWDRVEKAYSALVYGEGLYFDSALEAIQNSYQREVTDEFVYPSVIRKNGKPVGKMEDGDGVIFFNFRADRGRELTGALTSKDFDCFPRRIPKIKIVTMTKYDEKFKNAVAFQHLQLNNILGDIIAQMWWKQLRIAETEKYPHVTYFFNGGEERALPGVERILVPSPKVATYDLKPEMSAYPVADKTVQSILQNRYKMTVLNFANCDMVGHTGDFNAAKKAVEAVDECVGRIYKTCLENGYSILLTADHGNAEQMLDEEGGPFTAHTTNPVHFIYIDPDRKPVLKKGGALCNVAPAILEFFGLEKPKEMESSLVERYE